MISELDSAWNIASRVVRVIRKARNKKTGNVASRFLSLFENHGVTRSQIPSFFGHGLTIADTKNSVSLLNRLTDEMVSDASDMFAVRKEWLDGFDSQIYPRHFFYKDLEEFADFIAKTFEANNDDIYRFAHVIKSVSLFRRPLVALVIEEKIGMIGDRPIYRSHICDEWNDYWRAIAYLTACVAISLKNGIHVRGRKCKFKQLRRYLQLDKFLHESGKDFMDDLLPIKRDFYWYPEDMIDTPDVYLNQIDPEDDKFGYRAGLSTWLDLARAGWMDVDGKRASTIKDFENRLWALQKT